MGASVQHVRFDSGTALCYLLNVYTAARTPSAAVMPECNTCSRNFSNAAAEQVQLVLPAAVTYLWQQRVAR